MTFLWRQEGSNDSFLAKSSRTSSGVTVCLFFLYTSDHVPEWDLFIVTKSQGEEGRGECVWLGTDSDKPLLFVTVTCLRMFSGCGLGKAKKTQKTTFVFSENRLAVKGLILWRNITMVRSLRGQAQQLLPDSVKQNQMKTFNFLFSSCCDMHAVTVPAAWWLYRTIQHQNLNVLWVLTWFLITNLSIENN